jgi:predicted P-loop ATPase
MPRKLISLPVPSVDPSDWTPDESGDRLATIDCGTSARPTDGQPYHDADGCRRLGPVPKESLKTLPRWMRSLAWVEKEDKKTGATVCHPANNVANAVKILRNDWRWRGVLAIDEMAKQMTAAQIAPWHEYEPSARGGVWDTDADPTRMAIWFFDAYGMNLSKEKVSDAALVVAQDRPFHPVRQWLESLPEHDGTKRVEQFFPKHFAVAPSPYAQAVARILLVSLVARAMRPGCKVDTVVVLEGEQGLRKSSACKALVGERWFAENTCEVGTKDAQLALHGKWLLEMPELAGMTRAQVETVKAFFSRSSDWLRPPYGRRCTDLHRSSCNIATTNDSQYLRDRTGNRRYLPIRAGARIDADAIARDREQLFAEALALYRAGGKYYIDEPALLQAAQAQTEKRETIDTWEDRLRPWLHEHTVDGIRGETGVTVIDALSHLQVPVERQGPEVSVRVGVLFKRLHLVQTRPRDRQAETDAAAVGAQYVRPRVYKWVNPDSDSDDSES